MPSSGLKARRQNSGDSSRVTKRRIERRMRIADLSRPDDRPSDDRHSIRMGFVLDWGRVGAIFFRREPFSSLSAHACKIWARSDGRFEKSVLQVYNRMGILLYT